MGASKQHWRQALRHPVKFIGSSVVLTCVLLAAILALSGSDYAGWRSRAAQTGQSLAEFRRYLRDPLLYFLHRSPGTRDSVGLLQTKHGDYRTGSAAAPTSGKAVKPFERVLANVRYAPPGTVLSIPDFADVLGPGASLGPLAVDLQSPELGTPDDNPNDNTTPSANVPSAPDYPFVVVPPATTPTVPNVPPPVPAVPEPSTWFMLIMGMLLMGLDFRKQRSARNKTTNLRES